MRFVAVLLCWLITTVALAVAVPATWVQHNIVDADGYAALADAAARDPQLQKALASELAVQTSAMFAASGDEVDPVLVRAFAASYAAGPTFPEQFVQANGNAHRWMFSESPDSAGDWWVVDFAPILADPLLKKTMSDYGVEPPKSLPVPIVSAPKDVPPGRLKSLSRWGPWVSVGSCIVTVAFALLTLVAARSRSKAVALLGVSALLVGAAGWLGLELGRRSIDDALGRTTDDIRQIADIMLSQGETSLHQWLNVTLAAGGVLVVFGILVPMVARLRKREDSRQAPARTSSATSGSF